ncbi:MAG: Uncharacterised protein [Flavobacterium sp. SCGC AAA160-P02]|nr:MAG: Uncharacterised protein [Flavobacterium sp. SCGC AAA160-P02]
MRFHRFISTILHPTVLPTLGVFLFFIFVSKAIERRLQFIILGLVFIFTYIIPVLLLILFKVLGFIKSVQVFTIRERRIPILIMITILYYLGNTIIQIPEARNLGILFYGTSLSLAVIYLLFSIQLKSSLHLVSMGNMIGFFLILANVYSLPLLPLLIVLVLLSGILASSRLHLKAHTPKEVLVGFFLGIVSQFIVFSIL